MVSLGLCRKDNPISILFLRGLHELLEQATTRARYPGPGCAPIATSLGEVVRRNPDGLAVGRPHLLTDPTRPMHEKKQVEDCRIRCDGLDKNEGKVRAPESGVVPGTPRS